MYYPEAARQWGKVSHAGHRPGVTMEHQIEHSPAFSISPVPSTDKASVPAGNWYYCCSVPQSCPTLVTPWTAACQASLSIASSQSLLKLMSFELVMPSNNLILHRPLLLPTSIFPSIRVFSDESVLHIRLPKYLSFSFSISPSNEYSGFISFRTDCFDMMSPPL